MKNQITTFICLLLFISNNSWAEDDLPVRTVWDGNPIRINLAVGQERRVVFGQDVWTDIDQSIDPVLRTTVVNNTIYFLAEEAFETTRIMVGEENNPSNIYLIDITAKEGDTSGYADLIISREQETLQNEATQSNIASTEVQRPRLAEMIQFAARELYAPERLRLQDNRLTLTPISKEEVSLYRGAYVLTTPLASWRHANIYVTALSIKNLGSDPVQLKNTKIRGSFLMGGFQHYRLGPKNSSSESTTLYLVSQGPFWESVN